MGNKLRARLNLAAFGLWLLLIYTRVWLAGGAGTSVRDIRSKVIAFLHQYQQFLAAQSSIMREKSL